MSNLPKRRPLIRNIAEVPWDELPGHHGGASRSCWRIRSPWGPATSITASPATREGLRERHSHKVQSRSITCWRARG